MHDDGGDIEFKSFDESNGTLYLRLKGSCAGCPSEEKTLKAGFERMLKYYVAEVERVEAFKNWKIINSLIYVPKIHISKWITSAN